MVEPRSILKLKTGDLVPPEEDRRVEMYTYDVLLPCRRFEVDYKVAVLGHISPTLEFLLRLLKAADGISEDDARLFFGYNRTEMEFVVSEGLSPGYIERRANRLWLTQAGEALFSNTDDGPAIYSVESRRNVFGFDELAVAPQPMIALDQLEMGLPDLSLEVLKGRGRASKIVEERFHHFFRELGEREDRERLQRRDLYSIGAAVAGERFQVPVRIKLMAQASTPSMAEADLTGWRPDQEMSDRPEIDQAVGRFLSELKIPKDDRQDNDGYRLLVELAPEFFHEYTISTGLSAERYWREAVSRAGEPRVDRPTIALVGSLLTQGNIERLLRICDYGLRQSPPPGVTVAVPPMTKHWGASTLLRELGNLMRLKLRRSTEDETTEPEALCVFTGKPPKYLPHAFDSVLSLENCSLPSGFELFWVPGVAAVALVHAPLGAASLGTPVPLGFATFDPAVLKRIGDMMVEGVCRFLPDGKQRKAIEDEARRQWQDIAKVDP